MTERGPRGEQGNQGVQGERGELSRPLRRALVYLFATAAALALVALLAVFHEQAASRAALLHQAQAQQASQRRAGLALERQLCMTFGKAAALKPPAGDPRTNPSRAYLQGQHVIWTEVVTDLHCGRLPK